MHHSKSDHSSTVRKEILFSTTLAIGTTHLMVALKKFQEKYPNVKLTLVVSDSLPKHIKQSADILFRPVGGDMSDFVKSWFIASRHALFASQSYLDKWGTPKNPQDLLHHSIIGYGEQEFTYFKDINWHLKGRHSLPKLTSAVTINSTISVAKAALEGIGIASTPKENNALSPTPLIRVLPDIEGPTAYTYFCIRKTKDALLQNHMDSLKTIFKEHFEKIDLKIYQEEENL